MTAEVSSAGLDSVVANRQDHNRVIAAWLLVCCVTIFAMVVLGGVTRLTGSGLSMVQWAPIMGVLPPLNAVEWQTAFDLYQQYPEYQLKNLGMGLEGFKSIFYFEWAHRVLGRTIGVMFAVPFLYFLLRGQISRPMIPKMFALFVLGGLQGLMGWYMVKSGLVDVPHVSQYRLTAHLSLAIVIYAYMFWLVMDLLAPARSVQRSHRTLAATSLGLLALVLLTVVSGGFVAGLKAGFAFNTFPLMNGQWIPENVLSLQPLWRNFFENIATVQFSHRVLAISLALCMVVFIGYAWPRVSAPRLRLGLILLLLAVITQVTLGITTLVLAVPIPLAAAHQAGAVLLLTAILFVVHQLRRL
jgi:cytochrome c oxidase assembly protein subunit 15